MPSANLTAPPDVADNSKAHVNSAPSSLSLAVSAVVCTDRELNGDLQLAWNLILRSDCTCCLN